MIPESPIDASTLIGNLVKDKRLLETKCVPVFPKLQHTAFKAAPARHVGDGLGIGRRYMVARREEFGVSLNKSRDRHGYSVGTLASSRTGVMRRPGPHKNCWCTSQVLLSW